MKMPASLGLGLVIGIEESGLGNQHLRVLHIGLIEDIAQRRVTQKRDDRHLDAILNLDALISHLYQLRPGRAHQFGLELFADADQRISETRAAMMRGETTDAKIAPHLMQ